MIREHLIFRFAMFLSVTIHAAGFGLFAGRSDSFLKNGPASAEDRVIVFEIGFKEAVSGDKAVNIEEYISEGIEAKNNAKSNRTVIRGSNGFHKKERGMVREKYLLEVRRHIELFKFYPGEARRKYIQADVRLGFFIDKNGMVKDVYIVKSSGYGLLDRAGIDIILKANPFPKPPRRDLGEIETTIAFQL